MILHTIHASTIFVTIVRLNLPDCILSYGLLIPQSILFDIGAYDTLLILLHCEGLVNERFVLLHLYDLCSWITYLVYMLVHGAHVDIPFRVIT